MTPHSAKVTEIFLASRARAVAGPSLGLVSCVPIFAALSGPLFLAILRLQIGGQDFPADWALMLIALTFYLVASALYFANVFLLNRVLDRIGYLTVFAGVFFNLLSWLLRWVAAYERELEIFINRGLGPGQMPWLFRYIPFANLYDLSLAFAFSAGATTLLLTRRKDKQMIAALSLALAAIVLILAWFIGSELIDLPPILDSFWRPIHVGVASLSYGISLVCFAVAVLYLLKDGLEAEKLAIWTGIFSLFIFVAIARSRIFAPTSFGTYSASMLFGDRGIWLPLRADIPYVGFLLIASAFLIVAASIGFAIFLHRPHEMLRRTGMVFLFASLVAQTAAIGTLVYQLNTIRRPDLLVDARQFERFGVWLLQQQEVSGSETSGIGRDQLVSTAQNWFSENSRQLRVGPSSNPVEFAALVASLFATLFVFVITFAGDRFLSTLPSAESLDALMQRLGTLAFAGIALLLITGAVWANESWGRYWGWDSKETGAFIAWLAYGGFLHSRIAYGWRGRRSAYFAILAFGLVVFTYLGVSYLLPGLHSYA